MRIKMFLTNNPFELFFSTYKMTTVHDAKIKYAASAWKTWELFS